MGNRNWTEEEDDLLARYEAAGLTTRDAARALRPPATRNAVIGRANRIGVKFDPPPHRYAGPGCDSAAARQGWETRRARAQA